MESSSLEEKKIKDVRNLFKLEKLKKETTGTTIKGMRNLFRLKKENETIKFRIVRDIRHVFWHGEENCYKPLRVGGFWDNNNIEYKSNDKILSIEEYLDKIKPYLKDIISSIKKSDT